MDLIIDIGNTQTKAAIFKDGKKLEWKLFPGQIGISDLKLFAKNLKIKSAILSSVADHSKDIDNFLQKKFTFIELSNKTPLPIKNLYQTPGTLGKDRIANAVGAHSFYPGKNVLVIDAGTCIKYDFVNAKGQYQGGAISPGIDMRFKALHQFTSQLPSIKKSSIINCPLIGKTTRDSILSGVQNGILLEITGAIKLYREKFKEVIIIFTGGDSRFFKTLISKKNRIFAGPDLTLLGLNAILNFNNETI